MRVQDVSYLAGRLRRTEWASWATALLSADAIGAAKLAVALSSLSASPVASAASRVAVGAAVAVSPGVVDGDESPCDPLARTASVHLVAGAAARGVRKPSLTALKLAAPDRR